MRVSKDAIRKEMLQKRRALPLAERRSRSLSISRRLLSASVFQRAVSLQVYLSNSEEVQTDGIIQAAHCLKKQVVVPVLDRKRRMFFSRLERLKPEVLEQGPFGIRQPRLKFQKKVAPAEIGLWIIPGLAFDPQGHRIGYGGGYYDRVLESLGAPLLGLAFECQIMDHLPVEATDRPVDQVVTESRTIFCRED